MKKKQLYTFIILAVISAVSLFVYINFCNSLEAVNNRCKHKFKNDSIRNLRARETRILNYKRKTDSVNASLNWQLLKHNLWLSKNGDLGIETTEGNENGIDITKYITHIWNTQQSIPLNTIIDTLSFTRLGYSFYKDKNHVYSHYLMADGGFFRLVENADTKTFRMINDCYAKDKNHIYEERNLIIDSVDYKTFVTKTGLGCYARDKNTYYRWNEPVKLSEIENDSLVGQLKKLGA